MAKEGPHLRTPHYILKNPFYLQWITTQESRIWHCLIPRVIRCEMTNPLANMVYKEYFIKRGLLCACMRQDQMADLMGIKTTGQISRQLSDMDKKGVIKAHTDTWNSRTIKVYELGFLGKAPDRNQLWHLYIKLHNDLNDLKLEKLL